MTINEYHYDLPAGHGVADDDVDPIKQYEPGSHDPEQADVVKPVVLPYVPISHILIKLGRWMDAVVTNLQDIVYMLLNQSHFCIDQWSMQYMVHHYYQCILLYSDMLIHHPPLQLI